MGILMHLAHDRPDVQWATKEAARRMQHPTELDRWRVRRLTRFLAHHRELWWTFELPADAVLELRTFVDSDWAGCVHTRRSTSGGAMCLSTALLLTWARTQGGISLSSMEAEYRALVAGAQESLLVKNLCHELGIELEIILLCDSTSAQASMQRRGVLHVKHMALKLLFMKELAESGLIRLERVSSAMNGADWLTKAVGPAVIDQCLKILVGLRRERGPVTDPR